MSLKAFHIFFICAAIVLTTGFGYWGLSEFELLRNVWMLALGGVSLAGAVGLTVYLFWFIRKAKTLPS